MDFKLIYNVIQNIIVTTSLRNSEEYFSDLEKKPSIAWIRHDDPSSVRDLNGGYFMYLPAAYENLSSKVQTLVNSGELDFNMMGQYLVRNALAEINKKFPSVARLLFKFVISPAKVATLGVGFGDDGKYHILYNPKFLVRFAIKSVIFTTMEKLTKGEDNDKISDDVMRPTEFVNAVMFLFMHEALHVIESHSSTLRGKSKHHLIDNIVQDSQINTKLFRVMADKVPVQLKNEGISDGTFIQANINPVKLKEYLSLGPTDKGFNEVALYISRKFQEVQDYTGLAEVSYIYINFKDLFLSYSVDQVARGIYVLENYVMNGSIFEKVNDLPDVVKRALKSLAKAKSTFEDSIEMGDLVVYKQNKLPTRVNNLMAGVITKIDPKTYEVSLLSDPNDAKRINKSAVMYKLDPSIFPLKQGGVYVSYSGDFFVVREQNQSPAAMMFKRVSVNQLIPGSTSINTFFIYPFLLVKRLDVKTDYVIGDTVYTRLGEEGEVTGESEKWTIYQVEAKLFTGTKIDYYLVTDLSPVNKKENVLSFNVGDFVLIDGTEKVGKITGVPASLTGKYKVKIIPSEVWQSIISQNQISDDVDLNNIPSLVTEEYYAGELSKFDLPQEGEQKEGDEGDGQQGESKDGEGESKDGEGESKDGEGESKDGEGESGEGESKEGESGEGESKEGESGGSGSSDKSEDGGESEQKGGGDIDKNEDGASENDSNTAGERAISQQDSAAGGEGGESINMNREVQAKVAEELGKVIPEDEQGEALESELQQEADQAENLKDSQREDAQTPGEFKDVGKIDNPSDIQLEDILKDFDIPDELINMVAAASSNDFTEKVSWKSAISKLITDTTGISVIHNEQLVNRRMPGVFGSEEDIPKFDNILFTFDTSGSMSVKQSMKSLKIVSTFWDQPAFRDCKAFIAHWDSVLHYTSKVNKFSRVKFLSKCKEGFSHSGGTNFESSMIKLMPKLKPFPDFHVCFTDGDIFDIMDYYTKNAKLKKLVNRTIFVIVGEASAKSNRAYRGYPTRVKKNFILGAKK